MMKRLLYISCLCTEKEHYDGEHIKNTLIYDSLRKQSTVDVINLSSFKLINTIKIFLFGIFRKSRYDFFIISKDPHGANIIEKLLNTSRVSPSKIIYFEIGPFLYERILNKSINKSTFINNKTIVVETESLKNELNSIGFNNVVVFPNFKPIPSIQFNHKEYPSRVLKLVYFSRIENKKGIYDLIDTVIELNNNGIIFSLDIYGRPQTKNDEEKVISICNNYDFISYHGKIDTNDVSTYKMLSEYDLHVFPTRYPEGFPGTIIDFFIAGVPTISSSFARSSDILTYSDSIIFKQFDIQDLKDKLLYVYNNQNILLILRENSYKRKDDFSVEMFDKFLEVIFKQ